MGENCAVDVVRMEKPCQPSAAATTDCSGPEAGARDVDGRCTPDDPQPEETRKRADGSGHMDLLGVVARPADQSICPEIRYLEELKPCEMARLLNSTNLGTVINDRQLYRHRCRAGFRIGGRSRISLVRYTAWLMEERKRPRRRERNRQRAAEDPGCCLISVPDILELLKQQQFRCALSGRKLTPARAVLDHIVPVARGGKHRIENAQVLDAEVNRAKGTLTNSEFIEMCRAVAAHPAKTPTHGGMA